jgi:hypothetical protein
MDASDRTYLNFAEKTKKAFAFLGEIGFSEIEVLPTLVRYRKRGVEVDVFHSRQSYEIGAGVTVFGIRFSISEIIEASDPEAFKKFRYAMTTTPEGVAMALKELSSLLERYGNKVLNDDPQFISMLEKQRERNIEKLGLESLAYQLRPKASEAFQKKDYSAAAEIYSRIHKSLSSVELKKLDYAIRHSKKPLS